MGGAVSSGRDNGDLVDNLLDAEYIVTPQVENAFRAVDRGDYFYEEYRDTAYKDCAWREGPLHLSAPCIYAKVVEALDLRPGLRFLNLGSGTGYLSTVVGLLLGSRGVNHGVELNAEAVAYAYMKLQDFKRNSPAFDEFDFCEPVMLVGNCLQLAGCSQYDRVYCGAACPDERVDYVKNLLNVGGIAVVPVDDKLLRIQRISLAEWDSKSILSVSFATLVAPEEGAGDNAAASVHLPEPLVLSLAELSRTAVRDVLRTNVQNAVPRSDFRRPRRANGGSSADDESIAGGLDRSRGYSSLIDMLFPVNSSSSSSDSSSETASEDAGGEEEAIEVDESAEQFGLEQRGGRAEVATDSLREDFETAWAEHEARRPAGAYEFAADLPSPTGGKKNADEADPSCAEGVESPPAVGLCKRKAADECDSTVRVWTDGNVNSSSSSSSLHSSCSGSKRRQTGAYGLLTPASADGVSYCILPAGTATGEASASAAPEAETACNESMTVTSARECYTEETTSRTLPLRQADEGGLAATSAATTATAYSVQQCEADHNGGVPMPPPSNGEDAMKANMVDVDDVTSTLPAGGSDVAAASSVNECPDVSERESTNDVADAVVATDDVGPQQQDEQHPRVRRVMQFSLCRPHGGRCDAAGGRGRGRQGPVVVGLWRAPVAASGSEEEQRGRCCPVGGRSGSSSSSDASEPSPDAMLPLHRVPLGSRESEPTLGDDDKADEEADWARRRRAEQDYRRSFSRTMMVLVEALPLPDGLKNYVSHGRRNKGGVR